MPRGPRRSTSPTEGQVGTISGRKQRKIDAGHSATANGWYKPSANDLVAYRFCRTGLVEACTQYLVLREARTIGITTKPGLSEARGRIRGMAISLGMLRHPSKYGQPVWWDWVSKLEKACLAEAKDSLRDNAEPSE